MTSKEIEKLVELISKDLDIKVKSIASPPQGMDSHVLFIVDEKDMRYVLKIGEGTETDVNAYKLIEKNELNIPVPKVLLNKKYGKFSVIVMESIPYPLLESIPTSEIGKYVPSMIDTLNIMHSVKSQKTGYLNKLEETMTWKEFHLSKFDGTDDYLKWEKISKRKGLDSGLILSSVEKYVKSFSNAYFPLKDYSLIHTDYNQRNLFVNTDNYQIAGIIDWGESMFGDPIYDFARVRMLIWHFNLGNEVVDKYYLLMNYTLEQRRLDDLYWISRVIEYLAYYSEDLNEFNSSRIGLHQEFLRNLEW